MQKEEAILIDKAVKGDINSFESLIIKYEKMVFNIAYRVFGNTEDAKDMAQEVFIKFYKNIKKCDNSKSVKTWIYTIAYNTCIDEVRKRKGKSTVSIDKDIDTDEGSFSKQLPSNEVTPENAVINKEKTIMIQKAINKLSEEHKILIVYRDINGFSYSEIAEITNLSLGTVKSRLSRARNSLKNIIKKDMEQKNI